MAQSRPAVRARTAPGDALRGDEPGGAARVSAASRRALVALVAAQGAGLLSASVFLFVGGATGGAYDPGSARLGAAMALLGAVALGTLAWAVWRRRKWATSPLVVVEVLSIPVAVSLLQAAQPGYGVPLLVSAVLVLALVAASGMLTARRPPAAADSQDQPRPAAARGIRPAPPRGRRPPAPRRPADAGARAAGRRPQAGKRRR